MRMPFGIRHRKAQFILCDRPVPDPVVTALAYSRFSIRPRDNVAKDMRTRHFKEGELIEKNVARFRGQLAFGKQPPPGNVTRIRTRRWTGVNGRPYDRCDAVGANDKIRSFPCAVRKSHVRARFVLPDADDLLAQAVGVGGNELAKYPIETVPGNLHLRRGNAADDCSGPIEYNPIIGDDSDMRDVFASGRAQYCKSVPLSYKSGTSAPKSMLGSFINLDVVAILAE